jgi:hypothetical protein
MILGSRLSSKPAFFQNGTIGKRQISLSTESATPSPLGHHLTARIKISYFFSYNSHPDIIHTPIAPLVPSGSG